jgi:hypothetical protein
MQVPIVQQQVNTQPIQAPQLQAPSAVPGTFGEQVGAAVEKLGQTGAELGSRLIIHMQNQQKIADQEAAYDRINQLNKVQLTAAYGQLNFPSQDPEIEKLQSMHGIDFSKIEKNQGWLNAQGKDAENTAVNANIALEEIKNQMGKGLGLYGTKIYTREADRLNASQYDVAIKHQQQQVKAGKIATGNNYMFRQVQMAGNAITSDQVNQIFDNVQNANQTYSQVSPEHFSDENLSKTYSKVTQNAAQSLLTKTNGNLDAAEALVNGVDGDRLPEEEKNKIIANLRVGADKLIKNNERSAKIQSTNTFLEAYKGLEDGSLNWVHATDIDSLPHITEMDKAILKNVISTTSDLKGTPQDAIKKIELQTRTDKHSPFIQHMDDVFASGDQDKIMDGMREAATAYHNKQISQEAFVAISKIGRLRTQMQPNLVDAKDGVKISAQHTPIDAGMKAVHDFLNSTQMQDPKYYSQLADSISKDSDIQSAIDKVKKTVALDKNPNINNIPANGQVWVDKKTGVRGMVYPDGRVESVKGGSSNNGK